jgi:hypothetical protein
VLPFLQACYSLEEGGVRIPNEGCPEGAPRIRVNIINANLDRQSLEHLRSHPRIGKRYIYHRQGEQEDFMFDQLRGYQDEGASDDTRDQADSEFDDSDEYEEDEGMFGMGMGGGGLDMLMMHMMGVMQGMGPVGQQGLQHVLGELAGLAGGGDEEGDEDEDSESEWEEASVEEQA